MPRVIINRRDYMSKDIGNRVAMWLRRAGKYQRDLADELGISQQALSQKMKNHSFTYSDMLAVFDYLAVPDEEILTVMKI